MTETNLSRRDSLKTIAAMGAAGATMALGATVLTAEPAEAAQIHMDVALGTLNTALGQLQSAMADKGGFRVKAIAHCKQAIADVEAGIAFAKMHP